MRPPTLLRIGRDRTRGAAHRVYSRPLMADLRGAPSSDCVGMDQSDGVISEMGVGSTE